MTEPVLLKPWRTTLIVHVWPERDRINHELTDGCVCSPEVEFIEEGPRKGINVVHRALDGRKV